MGVGKDIPGSCRLVEDVLCALGILGGDEKSFYVYSSVSQLLCVLWKVAEYLVLLTHTLSPIGLFFTCPSLSELPKQSNNDQTSLWTSVQVFPSSLTILTQFTHHTTYKGKTKFSRDKMKKNI